MAEAELGSEYRICVFAIDLRPLFPMDVPIGVLNDWVIDEAPKDTPSAHPADANCINPTPAGRRMRGRPCRRAAGARLQALPANRVLSRRRSGLSVLRSRATRSGGVRPPPQCCSTRAFVLRLRLCAPCTCRRSAFRFGSDLRLIGATRAARGRTRPSGSRAFSRTSTSTSPALGDRGLARDPCRGARQGEARRRARPHALRHRLAALGLTGSAEGRGTELAQPARGGARDRLIYGCRMSSARARLPGDHRRRSPRSPGRQRPLALFGEH